MTHAINQRKAKLAPRFPLRGYHNAKQDQTKQKDNE